MLGAAGGFVAGANPVVAQLQARANRTTKDGRLLSKLRIRHTRDANPLP
jgi:hypothetical protein